MKPPPTPIHAPEYNLLARYFDLINEKYVPYARQCDFLEAAFRKYGKDVHNLLDLACGTGLHAFDLARRGYRVVGVDRSPEMLAEATGKLTSGGKLAPEDKLPPSGKQAAGGLPNPPDIPAAPGDFPAAPPTFFQADLRELRFEGVFEAAFAFNYPIAYLFSHAEVQAGFAGISRALRPGGLFLFDFISNYNPEPAPQEESAENEAVQIDCRREFAYDYLRQVLLERSTYTVLDKHTGEKQTLQGYDEFRFYYPQELAYYLEHMGGFRVLGFHRRWEVEAEANRSDMVVVAEKTVYSGQ